MFVPPDGQLLKQLISQLILHCTHDSIKRSVVHTATDWLSDGDLINSLIDSPARTLTKLIQGKLNPHECDEGGLGSGLKDARSLKSTVTERIRRRF